MPDELIGTGKFVALTYRIEDHEGQLLEQTDVPVGYIHGGQTELIGGMDAAIEGCCVGDEVALALAPEQGFGPRDPSLTFTDQLENVPSEFHFIGAEVPMQNEQGEVRQFHVTQIENGLLTVDGNHPFAGKPLQVRIRIVEVREPTHAELSADLGGDERLPGGSLH
ncbi:peptidylprolyl isomerase [Thiocapsa imhoffii]|uniref:Peptidyl-prolyl cis-trans isomerase n=1 Tax=Thiocapsa imhoffii TaxID=382777 RepID=A0A9X0WEH6_9GAMM|nr:FKBP-type peptidyl-prolyl cis-trans isomerase [Thiocapsa imhoffii]MBK1643075.1 peptidylprolyl isomerase [Thiocapsa imhoffii]